MAEQGNPQPIEGSASETWAKAAAAVDAMEAGKTAPNEPTAEPTPEPDPEKTPTEPAPAEKSDEEAPAAAAPVPEQRMAELQKLASELGLKVDDRGVSKDERYGFRQEKREWQAKSQKREAEFQQRLRATQEYFAPLHPAVEAVKAGDYDQAIRKLAEFAKDEEVAREGLNGASKRYLKRAAGEDPRVDELARWKAQREKEDAERAEAEQTARQQQLEQQQRKEFTEAKQAELAALPDPALSKLAKLPNFAPRVVAYMEHHWDGYETVSLEEAADAVAKQARAAYDELHQVFGDPDPSIQESAGNGAASRSGKATVGKKKPQTAPVGRNSAEASRRDDNLDDRAWRQKWAGALKSATD